MFNTPWPQFSSDNRPPPKRVLAGLDPKSPEGQAWLAQHGKAIQRCYLAAMQQQSLSTAPYNAYRYNLANDAGTVVVIASGPDTIVRVVANTPAPETVPEKAPPPPEVLVAEFSFQLLTAPDGDFWPSGAGQQDWHWWHPRGSTIARSRYEPAPGTRNSTPLESVAYADSSAATKTGHVVSIRRGDIYCDGTRVYSSPDIVWIRAFILVGDQILYIRDATPSLRVYGMSVVAAGEPQLLYTYPMGGLGIFIGRADEGEDISVVGAEVNDDIISVSISPDESRIIVVLRSAVLDISGRLEDGAAVPVVTVTPQIVPAPRMTTQVIHKVLESTYTDVDPPGAVYELQTFTGTGAYEETYDLPVGSVAYVCGVVWVDAGSGYEYVTLTTTSRRQDSINTSMSADYVVENGGVVSSSGAYTETEVVDSDTTHTFTAAVDFALSGASLSMEVQGNTWSGSWTIDAVPIVGSNALDSPVYSGDKTDELRVTYLGGFPGYGQYQTDAGTRTEEYPASGRGSRATIAFNHSSQSVDTETTTRIYASPYTGEWTAVPLWGIRDLGPAYFARIGRLLLCGYTAQHIVGGDSYHGAIVYDNRGPSETALAPEGVFPSDIAPSPSWSGDAAPYRVNVVPYAR